MLLRPVLGRRMRTSERGGMHPGFTMLKRLLLRWSVLILPWQRPFLLNKLLVLLEHMLRRVLRLHEPDAILHSEFELLLRRVQPHHKHVRLLPFWGRNMLIG